MKVSDTQLMAIQVSTRIPASTSGGTLLLFKIYQFIKVYCQLQDRSVYNSINSGTEIRELGNVQLKVKVFVLSNYLYLCLENTVYEQQSLEVANL